MDGKTYENFGMADCGFGNGVRPLFSHPQSAFRNPTDLKQSFSRPERAVGTDILQRKGEAKTAFFAGAKIELTEFEAQAVTVGIIANLCDRLWKSERWTS